MTYPKLIRDKIEDLIREEGRVPNIRTASPQEYGGLLRQKLVEEVREFLASGEPEELADILEVLRAIAEDAGIDWSKLDLIRARKEERFGAFRLRRILLVPSRRHEPGCRAEQ